MESYWNRAPNGTDMESYWNRAPNGTEMESYWNRAPNGTDMESYWNRALMAQDPIRTGLYRHRILLEQGIIDTGFYRNRVPKAQTHHPIEIGPQWYRHMESYWNRSLMAQGPIRTGL